jgi:hypothetical protein
VARDTYITANPLGAGTELQQINTQYWIASFLNGPEAFANFRRSGFPTLTSNPYGQPPNADVPNGTFRRRLSYPASELSINTTNVNAAIAAQGAINSVQKSGRTNPKNYNWQLVLIARKPCCFYFRSFSKTAD